MSVAVDHPVPPRPRRRARLAEPGERGAWDRFVEGHPQANYCHLYGWLEVAERTYGRPGYPLVVGAGAELDGVLPLVWMKGRLARSRLVSMPYLDRGGVLARSPESARALWSEALTLAARQGAAGIDLRGPVGSPEEPPPATRQRWVVRLGDSIDELWRRLGPKVRNQVRKARKSGLCTRRAAAAELDLFYRVFARNMLDLGSPVHARRFFAEILRVFARRSTLYLTFGRDRLPVAGALAIRFGDTITVPWASALRSHRSSCPNHSLYWRALRDAIDAGAVRFDFGRSHPGSGTARFKAQWATEAVPLAWRCVDADGSAAGEAYLSVTGHAGLARLWRHLPLAAANRFGPPIRGRLPH